MREIEVKARLHNPAMFLAAAKKLAIDFGPPIIQDDTTYEDTLPNDHPDYSVFRIREQDGTHILTMKHRASSRSRDNHEYETIIDNPAAVIKMLHRLGYEPGIRIVKQRRVAHYNDIELTLDTIDELGVFVEAEKLAADDADVDQVQHELWALLTKLGVLPTDRTHLGYDLLVRELRRGSPPLKTPNL